MNLLYPKIPRNRLIVMFRLTASAAMIAGLYGAVHDQISFTISPEYFTKFKFQQFACADLGLPQRIFVGEIGFLATWWVGLIAGWILARVGLAELSPLPLGRAEIIAFAIVIAVAIAGGISGGTLGYVKTSAGDFFEWQGWQDQKGVVDLRSFVIVAYLHSASYLGGLIGVIAAVFYVRRAVAAKKLTSPELHPKEPQ